MAEGETPEQFRDRMRSIGYLSRGRTRNREILITRSTEEGGVDAGKRAKVVVDELGTTVTTSDNRQDVNVVPETVYQDVKVGLL
jgi:hypothetical protein